MTSQDILIFVLVASLLLLFLMLFYGGKQILTQLSEWAKLLHISIPIEHIAPVLEAIRKESAQKALDFASKTDTPIDDAITKFVVSRGYTIVEENGRWVIQNEKLPNEKTEL